MHGWLIVDVYELVHHMIIDCVSTTLCTCRAVGTVCLSL